MVVYKKLKTLAKDMELARDPFSLRVFSSEAAGYCLRGIAWDVNTPPAAIVDDRIVGIGTKVENYTVVDIQQNKVIFNDGTKNIEISPWQSLPAATPPEGKQK